MSDTRWQVSLLLRRAAELRAQGQEIQRKLRAICAEIARLQSRHDASRHHDHPDSAAQLWRLGPGDTGSANTQM